MMDLRTVSTALTSLSLERAAARGTTLTAQQNSLPILWFSSCSSNCTCRNGSWEGRVVIMCISNVPMRPRGGEVARRAICNWRKYVWMSIRRARNPAKQTKSHQAMWRGRASTGIPSAHHNLSIAGGEFPCASRAMGEQLCAQSFWQ